MMKERQIVGIAKAKSEGRYKGRAPTARAQSDKVREVLASGVGVLEVAELLNISRSSVWRISKASVAASVA